LSPALLWAVAATLALAAARELIGARGEQAASALRRIVTGASGGRVRSLAEAALWLGIPERIRRAGLTGQLSPPMVVIAKVAGAGIGCLGAVSVTPALPGRLALVIAPLLAVAGFLAPDALLERGARRRAARLVAALPDALDMLATGAASGRAPAVVLGEISTGASGPLAVELAIAVADFEGGLPQREAI
jgi:Flp pilus assembly protein TadB